MERQSPDVSEPRAPDKPDDDSQPDDDRGCSSFWSRIYSVITHPFRVVGNLLCLSCRRTSEPVPPMTWRRTSELRENKLHLTSEHAHGFRLISEPDEDSQPDDDREPVPPKKDDFEPIQPKKDEFGDPFFSANALYSRMSESSTTYATRASSATRGGGKEIKKILIERPVILYPVPPAAPPPNPPI